MKPVLVDSEKLDDLTTKEIELVFGYKSDYSKLSKEDLEFIIESCRTYRNFKTEELISLLRGNDKISSKKKKRFELSRTERIKRLGQGFSIQAFEPLLKPLTDWFY